MLGLEFRSQFLLQTSKGTIAHKNHQIAGLGLRSEMGGDRFGIGEVVSCFTSGAEKYLCFISTLSSGTALASPDSH